MDAKDVISRWVFAIGFWGCAIYFVRLANAQTELGWLVVAILLGVIGASRIFKDVLHLAAKPFTALIDAIVFPRVSAGKPEPNYKLAEYYREIGRWQEAEVEYLTILKYHRREVRAYRQMISLLAERDRMADAEKILQKARRNLRHDPDSVHELEMLWDQLQSCAA